MTLLGLTVAVAGCQAILPSRADRVTIQNDTTTPVTVHVNAGWVATIEAGAMADIPIRGHGGPPFRIEARSRGGQVLFEMSISADDYAAVRDGHGSMTSGIAPGCGWIEARYGQPDPAAPVPPEAPVGRAAPGGVGP